MLFFMVIIVILHQQHEICLFIKSIQCLFVFFLFIKKTLLIILEENKNQFQYNTRYTLTLIVLLSLCAVFATEIQTHKNVVSEIL